MGIGYHLLSVGGGTSGGHNIFIQLTPPDSQGLWVKADLAPEHIESMNLEDIRPRFSDAWQSITLPAGYSTFALCRNNLYIFGKADGTYQKADTRINPLYFIDYEQSETSIFTSTAVIGNKIYAVKDGPGMELFEMNTLDPVPEFEKKLPIISSFPNPRICAWGTKIYAVMGASSGYKSISYIDTASDSPAWISLPNLIDDTSKCSVIAHNDMLYIIGTTSSGYRCYAHDLNTASGWQPCLGFSGQGTYLAALSTVGGIIRIINSGYATTARNCLSLIDGIWKTPEQTGFTLLTNIFTSYSNAYHNEQHLYVKDKNSNTMYVLDRSYPDIDFADNTLIVVKGGGKNALTASAGNYRSVESVAACYYFTKTGEEKSLTRLPIYAYSESDQWEEIVFDI